MLLLYFIHFPVLFFPIYGYHSPYDASILCLLPSRALSAVNQLYSKAQQTIFYQRGVDLASIAGNLYLAEISHMCLICTVLSLIFVTTGEILLL